MPAFVRIIRGRWRRRCFVQLDDGTALEVVLPIHAQIPDQKMMEKAREAARRVAAQLNATAHIPTDFLELGQTDFSEDGERIFRFPIRGLVKWCERLLFRWKVRVVYPPGWFEHPKNWRQRKISKAPRGQVRDAKGRYISPNAKQG